MSREIFLYTVFGLATTIENIGLFEFLVFRGLDYKISNFISLVTTILTAYVLNKQFVFFSETKTARSFFKEFFLFLCTRGGTMLVDYFGLILLVLFFRSDPTIAKLIVTVIVVVLNYLLGKKLVFIAKKRDPTRP